MKKGHKSASLTMPGTPTGEGRLGPQSPATSSKVTAIEEWLLKKMLETLGDPPLQLALWDGREVSTSTRSDLPRMTVHDRGTLLRLIKNPELAFGEGYSSGRIEVEGELIGFLESVYRAMAFKDEHSSTVSRLLTHLYQPRLPHRSTLERARENIHHHYDIGNDFYRLWLDEQMVYTCAYFPSETATLEEAQTAKMHHVCRKVGLQPGETVVEAGCGWGALALHMARHYGVTVRAYNISKEQVAFARERARAEGLDHKVEFVEGDYRTISGEYDAFVSVGMLEHVGPNDYAQLGAVINRCLKPKGRGLIHSVGKNRPRPLTPWIEKYIFPGAYTPSLGEMMDIFEPSELSVLDVENLRLHYAKTLALWLERFDGVQDQVRAMFDEDFVRAWRLYLAGCSASFASGDLQLFQVAFARHDNNAIPWTRDYLYSNRAES